MKKFFAEFKKFINRGNVIDLSVGVIIGGAFSAIVNALTNHILMPFINWVLLKITGGVGLNSIYTYLEKAVDETGEIILEDSIYINWGSFITAVINFILIAIVLFAIVKAFNKLNQATNEAKEARIALTLKNEGIRKIRKEEKVSKKGAESLYAIRLEKAEKEALELKEKEEAERLAAEEEENARLAALKPEELTNELLLKILSNMKK